MPKKTIMTKETNTSPTSSTLLTETEETLPKNNKDELRQRLRQLKLLSEEDAARLAGLRKLSVQNDPFLLIDDGYLTIKTKAGDMIPLVLNKAQRKLHKIVKDLWERGKIIRLWVLKARQLGASTYFEALIYSITSQLENQNATIIADDVKGSNYIFEMSKLYHEKCPEYLRPGIKRSNEKKLEFDKTHSQILIDTAENKEAGRKFTFRVVHLSEYAFFRNPSHLMLGLSQAVPSMARTIIIKETTANGFNFAKEEWDAAVNGETDYVPVFIPWYWGEEYRMPVNMGEPGTSLSEVNPYHDFIIGDPALGELTKDENTLHNQMAGEGIDHILERLSWRRWCIRNNCENKIDNFKQEYPSTPEEAFIATGQCFFDKQVLVKQLKQETKPLFKANILKENLKWVVRKCDDGDFSFYTEPSDYGQYCIGGDACSGSGLDFATLIARDKQTNDIVATFRAKIDPDELAFRAMQLGNLLNKARVAIENDKFGFAANNKLRTIYGNIYIQRSFNKTENKMIEKFGWDTTAVTRPMMLSQMQEEIREGSLQLKDPILIKECLTFIKNPETKKVEAQEGMHDDTVIACAISGAIRHEEPYRVKPDRSGTEVATTSPNAGMKFGKK